MTQLDLAIQKLAFAEARSSSAEAMIEIARHRSELAARPEVERATEAETTARLIDRARRLSTAHKIDKRA